MSTTETALTAHRIVHPTNDFPCLVASISNGTTLPATRSASPQEMAEKHKKKP